MSILFSFNFHDSLPLCRMARCCAFLVFFIWVAGHQLASCKIIDKAYSGDGVGEAQNLRDPGDVADQLSGKGLFDKLQKFIKGKNLEQGCTEEVTKKTKHVLKEREEKDKTILRNNYQILQHGEESFASHKEWLSAIKSGICTGCLVKKICSHPPSFLSKYVSSSSWKSLTQTILCETPFFAEYVYFLLSKYNDRALSEMTQKRLIWRLNINSI